MTGYYRLKHTLIDWLRWTGIRNRLRCPECEAVGTWKPHGGFWDREDERKVARWMCKWCGHYLGPEGVRGVIVDPVEGHWSFLEDLTPGVKPLTPDIVMHMSEIPKCWPWRG